jgi:hypothetical protein
MALDCCICATFARQQLTRGSLVIVLLCTVLERERARKRKRQERERERDRQRDREIERESEVEAKEILFRAVLVFVMVQGSRFRCLVPSEVSTYKTVRAIFWPWLEPFSGKSLSARMRCSVIVLQEG